MAIYNYKWSLLDKNKFVFAGTLSGFFSQIISGDDGTRERCIKFLATKLKAIGHDIVTKEPEDLLIAECKKVLQVIFYGFSDITTMHIYTHTHTHTHTHTLL